jgi:hypothetical protein
MKHFFQGFNLARGIIVVSLLGSLVLGFLCWKRSSELQEMREDLDSRMKPTVQALMQAAQTHSKLSNNLKSEGLKEFKDFETYIRRIAAKDKVEVGDVDLSPSEAPLTRGVIDKKYHIKSKDRERSFSRLKITNFLTELERASGRVKVTSAKIENAEKRLKPEAVPEDFWTFEADVTSRQSVAQ